MMRFWLYLVATAPMLWAMAFVSALPSALLLPPDIIQQSLLSVPIFCLAGGWVGGWIMHRFALSRDHQSDRQRRRCQIFVTLLHSGLCIIVATTIWSGILTPKEALILAVLIAIAAHGIALRWFTSR